MVNLIDRVSTTIIESLLELGPGEDAEEFILNTARDFNLDPTLLRGRLSEIMAERTDEERKQTELLETQKQINMLKENQRLKDELERLKRDKG